MEHGFELGQGLQVGIGARSLILVEDSLAGLGSRAVHGNSLDLHRHDLLVELARGLCRQRVPVAAVGEGVLVLERHVVLLIQALGSEPHVHVDLGPMVDKPGIGRELMAAARDQAHGLGAAGDDALGSARADAVRGHGDRLKAGAAEAVDGNRRDEVRQSRAQRDDAGHVIARFRLRHGAADDHVVDLILTDLRIAIQQRSHNRAAQIVRTGVAECAPWRFAYGCAQAVHDNGFLHGGPHYPQFRSGFPVFSIA